MRNNRNKSLEEHFNHFIEKCEYGQCVSKETIRGYRAVFKLLSEMVPNLTAKDLNEETMISFFKKLETRKRKVGRDQTRAGVRKSTIGTYRGKLSKFFDYLVEKKVIDGNPFKNIPYPSISYTDRKYLKREEVKKILMAVDYGPGWASPLVQKRNKAIIITLLYCGLRRGELIGLEVLDIDFKRKTMTVRAATSKSGRDRTIPVAQQAIEAIEDYLKERKSYKSLKLFVSATRDEGLTFHGLKHLGNKLVEISGVKFHWHRFRHTFAVNLFNNECDSIKIQRLLGHKDLKMTGTYLRGLSPKMMEKEVGKINLDNLIE